MATGKVFISHVSEEAPVARALRRWVAEALGDDRVFASSHDIKLGEQWLEEISKALGNADALVVLCSPRSVERPWVMFEAGGGWGRRVPVVPVCHSGMTRESLPDPLGAFQGIDLNHESACEKLMQRLADVLTIRHPESLDYPAMMRDIESAMTEAGEINPWGINPIDPPRGGGPGVLVDLSHQQSTWSGKSIFDLAEGPLSSPVGLDMATMPDIRALRDSRHLWLSDLKPWSGLILGSPWRTRLGREARVQVTRWVRQGGRLLLLGFELGDRHHGANLNAIAHEFGLHFNSDIVAPAAWSGDKPYDQVVELVPEDGTGHPLTEGIRRLKGVNLQSLTVDPGSRELIRIGGNKIARPALRAVNYAAGAMLTPTKEVELIEEAGWVPVAVEAPVGLTDEGRVVALGTWDWVGRQGECLEDSDNTRFLANVVAWLAGQV